MPIKFAGEPFCVSKEFWYRKVSSKGGGSFTALSKIFLSHRTEEKLSQGTTLCFRKFLVEKNILWIRGGGGGGRYHDFPSKFLSHCNEIFHWRTLWCFTKKFFYRKLSCIGGGGGGITVLSKFFVSQDRKNCAREPLCVSENFW